MYKRQIYSNNGNESREVDCWDSIWINTGAYKKDLDDASFHGKPGKNRNFKIQRIPPRRVQEICKRVCGKIDKKIEWKNE